MGWRNVQDVDAWSKVLIIHLLLHIWWSRISNLIGSQNQFYESDGKGKISSIMSCNLHILLGSMSVCSRTLQIKLKSHLNFNWILKIVFQISDDIVKILEFLMILSKWDKMAYQYCSIHRLVVMTCFRRFWNKINNFFTTFFGFRRFI